MAMEVGCGFNFVVVFSSTYFLFRQVQKLLGDWHVNEQGPPKRFLHKVDRVLGFFSSRSNELGSPPQCPHPLTLRRVCPHLLVPGMGTHSLAGEGLVVPIRTRGQTMWNSTYILWDIPRGSPKTIRFLATRSYHQTIQFGKSGPPLFSLT